MNRKSLLFKAILERVKNSSTTLSNQDLSFDGYTEDEVDHHLRLSIEQGFLDGRETKLKQSRSSWNIKGITWIGHDYLDSLSDPIQ